MVSDMVPAQPKDVVRKAGRPQGSRAEATRQEIIAAAKRLIGENAGASVAFEAIAAEAGVSRTALYYYFPSKADLARAVLMSSLDWQDWQWWRHAVEGAPETYSFAEKLRHVFHAGIAGTVEAREHRAVSYFNLVATSESNQELRQVLRFYVAEMRETLLELVDDGVREGSLPAGTDRVAVVDAIMGLMWSFASGMAKSPNATVSAQIMQAVDFVCTNTIRQLTEGEPSVRAAPADDSEPHPSTTEQNS
jgi:AcrR family transcriptional regulator